MMKGLVGDVVKHKAHQGLDKIQQNIPLKEIAEFICQQTNGKGKELCEKLHTSVKFILYSSVVGYTILTIAVAALYYFSIKRGNYANLPRSAKIGLGVYAVYAPYTLTFFLIVLIQDDWLKVLNMWQYCAAFMPAIALFLSNHWHFSAQYLRAAALFRKVFQALNHSVEAFEQIERR